MRPLKKSILVFYSFFAFSMINAQESGFVGTWQGTLQLGVELHIVFHVSSNGKGVYKSTADSPDQSAFGLKCDTTIVEKNQIDIQMKGLMASFSGSLSDDSTINGSFTQQAT